MQTENQEETDRYWDAIVSNGGAESACGWCKDCDIAALEAACAGN
jgi:predicted 3-demethylubiquinone-9 3-methyltransferase (glyoxalase superfamily)